MADPQRLEMTLAEAMYSMRAIRRVRPDPIAAEDVELMLDAARQAPNGGNAQPWHFLVVQDPDQIRRFAPLYHEAWWAKRADVGIVDGDERLQTPVMQSARRLADEIGQAPLLVFLCATAQGAGAAASVIPAVQNLLLAGRSLGIGGNITTLHATVDGRVKTLFNIPDQAQVVYCVPMGYPRGRFGPLNRKPLNEIVSQDRWGERPAWAAT